MFTRKKLANFATTSLCRTSHLMETGRGLKRKIGCIDVRTQMGRKNKIGDDYIAGETIGQGNFGFVRLCWSRFTGAEYACKTLSKKEQTVHREVEIMQHLSGHPGIVTLRAVYEEVDCYHLVMELCSGGRLSDKMSKEGFYTEQMAANLIKKVMLAIKHCHDLGVVHRDVKPDNILLTARGEIKLADFGLAKRICNGQNLSDLAGTPEYIAPEILLRNHSEKVDVWSAGVILHNLLVGFLPFDGDSLEALFEAIMNVKLDYQKGKWDLISKPARDLVGRMLTRDVQTRITADEVLKHPWILFFTEPTLERLPIRTILKNQIAWRDCKMDDGCHGEIASSLLSSESRDSREEAKGVLIGVQASAISHVRISESKRSRLCLPTRLVDQ